MLKKIMILGGAALIALSVSGCVTKGTFEMMESEASRLSGELNDLQARYNNLRDEKGELNLQKETLEQEKAALIADNQQLNLILEAKSDSFSQLTSDLRQKIADLENDHDLQVRAYEVQIDELGKKTQEVLEMSGTYEALLSKMKNEIDKGQVTISELKGKLTVNMVDAVLFDSGKAEVKAEGLEVLQKVVDILKSVTDKAIRIEGHTDNVKIGGVLAQKYPTNWELSAARAVNVTRFFQEQGLNPENLGSVAYGEYKPVAENESAEGRAQNRRIEIILVAKE